MTDATDDVELRELVCEARRERLGDLLAVIARACERAALDPDVAFDVRLATEEVVTNVIEHGYAGRDGKVDIQVELDDGAVTVHVRDACPPFDPTAVPSPDTDAPLARRPLGGMGVHLSRELTDRMTHRILPSGGNELTLVKRLLPAGGGTRDGHPG